MSKQVMTGVCLAVLLALLVGLGGCGLPQIVTDLVNTDSGQQQSSTSTSTSTSADLETSIPLLLVASDPSSQKASKESRQQALAASWNPSTGDLTINSEPVYTYNSGQDFPRIAWDGGQQIYACADLPDAAKNFDPGSASNMIVTPVNLTKSHWPLLIQSSSEENSLLLACPAGVPGTGEPGSGLTLKEQKDGQIRVKNVSAPPWPARPELMPYVVSGSYDDCCLLVFYNELAVSNDSSSVLHMALATVSGSQTTWSKISGEGGYYMAGAGASMAFISSKIYSGDPASVFDLSTSSLEPQSYQPILDLRAGIKDNIARAAPDWEGAEGQPHLGVYKGTLLVSFWLPEELFVWEVQNDKCVAQLHFDQRRHTWSSTRTDGNQAGQERPFKYDLQYIVMPHDGYGNDR